VLEKIRVTEITRDPVLVRQVGQRSDILLGLQKLQGKLVMVEGTEHLELLLNPKPIELSEIDQSAIKEIIVHLELGTFIDQHREWQPEHQDPMFQLGTFIDQHRK